MPFRKKKKNVFSGSRPCLGPDSPFAIKEAYNSIRTKLIFTGKGEKCPVFAVTSSLDGDGKTTNAVSLAVSFAMAKQKVLLIDADMRRPSIHRYFDLECRNGLSEILAGMNSDIQLRTTDMPNLSVLTAGQVPPNPVELLGTKHMETLLEYVRRYFDYVIIDTPPVNVVTDACVLAEKITGYVLIVQSGRNHIPDIRDATKCIEEMNGHIAGIVLNDPFDRAKGHYSYRYNRYYRNDKYRYYGETPAAVKKQKKNEH